MVTHLKYPDEAFNIHNFISFHNSGTRASKCNKLLHNLSLKNKSRHFYFNRICKLWNFLLVVDLDLSTQTIKLQIKSFLRRHFDLNFVSSNPCSYHAVCPCSKCFNSPLPMNFSSILCLITVTMAMGACCSLSFNTDQVSVTSLCIY